MTSNVSFQRIQSSVLFSFGWINFQMKCFRVSSSDYLIKTKKCKVIIFIKVCAELKDLNIKRSSLEKIEGWGIEWELPLRDTERTNLKCQYNVFLIVSNTESHLNGLPGDLVLAPWSRKLGNAWALSSLSVPPVKKKTTSSKWHHLC